MVCPCGEWFTKLVEHPPIPMIVTRYFFQDDMERHCIQCPRCDRDVEMDARPADSVLGRTYSLLGRVRRTRNRGASWLVRGFEQRPRF